MAYVTCPESFGSIIGGVVGGLIVIVLAVVAIVCILRKYPNILKSESLLTTVIRIQSRRACFHNYDMID